MKVRFTGHGEVISYEFPPGWTAVKAAPLPSVFTWAVPLGWYQAKGTGWHQDAGLPGSALSEGIPQGVTAADQTKKQPSVCFLSCSRAWLASKGRKLFLGLASSSGMKGKVWWKNSQLSWVGCFKGCVLVKSRDHFLLSSKVDKWNWDIFFKIFYCKHPCLFHLEKMFFVFFFNMLFHLDASGTIPPRWVYKCSVLGLFDSFSAKGQQLHVRLWTGLCWFTLAGRSWRKKTVLWVTLSSSSPVPHLPISS